MCLAAAALAQDGLGRELATQVDVTIQPDGAGGYRFVHAGEFAQSNGDLDFSQGRARGRVMRIEFVIAEDSVAGATFKPVGDDAFWIVEKALAGPGGEPTGPYFGPTFPQTITHPGGKRLIVIDKNDDGKLYRYMLRFDLNGKLICDDPDMGNGGPGH